MFQTCFECGRRGEALQSHPLPISPLLQTLDPCGDTFAGGGGVRIVGRIRTTPSLALAMLIVDFVGVVRGFRGLTYDHQPQSYSDEWVNFAAQCETPTHIAQHSFRIWETGWYTVSRVLFRKRELTEFCAKLGEF